ncbi:hypothetical protein TrispH2_001547 [Trichoplax sp. H2]|nr:hypothetical protein TrispH2_001547 [Trichoplax sp. H2]|eukprot:RDD47048.1 hypothetical protein TrispH2_001547 [Trichoplax sp. H2]
MYLYSLLILSYVIAIAIPSNAKALRYRDENASMLKSSIKSKLCLKYMQGLQAVFQRLSDVNICSFPRYNTRNFELPNCEKEQTSPSPFTDTFLDMAISNLPFNNTNQSLCRRDILYPTTLANVSFHHALINKNSTDVSVQLSIKLYRFYLKLLHAIVNTDRNNKVLKLEKMCSIPFMDTSLDAINVAAQEIPFNCFDCEKDINPIFLYQNTKDIAFVFLHAPSDQSCEPYHSSVVLMYQLLKEFKFEKLNSLI